MARQWRVFRREHNPAPGGRFSHEEQDGERRNMRQWRQPGELGSPFYECDSNPQTEARVSCRYVIVTYNNGRPV